MELERTLESLLDCKEIKPVNPKGNQLWIFTGRTDAEAEAPVLWPLDGRANSLEKTLILGKTEGNRRRGWQRMRCLDRITNWLDMNLSKLWGRVEDRGARCAAVHEVAELDRTRHLNNHNNLWQRRQEYTMRKKDSSVGGAGNSGKLLLNEWNENIFYAVQKNKLKIYWRPKCKTRDHKAPRRKHRQKTLWHK